MRSLKYWAAFWKIIEHLEAAGALPLELESPVSYEFSFKKLGNYTLGVIRTKSDLALSPELVEILDEYWYTSRARTAT